jgi:hypothetical protein
LPESIGKFTRHKCFISYHRDDAREVESFIERFDDDGNIFMSRVLGVAGQDLIGSNDASYIMRAIRERFLRDSTVTIVMIGRCTWTRRFVDWEIASTLRNDANNKRSGLMAVTLPSVASSSKKLPPRLKDNWDGRNRYARWWKYPTSASQLAGHIEDAHEARDSRYDLIINSRQLFGSNRSC